MQENENSRKRRRGLVAAVLSAAAVAVALPISGALASGEPVPAQDQTTPRDDSPRDHRDCPDKDGRGGQGSDASVEL